MIAELKDKILNLSNDISLLISECPNLNSLEEIRINTLGKKGSITSYLKDLIAYDDNSKREIGSIVNEIKNKINNEIIDRTQFFKKQILQEKINTEKIDVTLTSHENETGTLHPLSRTVEELCAIFEIGRASCRERV